MTLFHFACLVVYLIGGYATWCGLWAVAIWASSDDYGPIDWREQLFFFGVSAIWPLAVVWWLCDSLAHRLLRRIARLFSKIKGRGQ